MTKNHLSRWALALGLLSVPAAAQAQTFTTTTIAADAAIVWRDWVVNGIPSSGVYNPRKSDIRRWGATVGNAITQFQSQQALAGTGYTTQAAMNADLAHPAGTIATVFSDSTSNLNGVYIKVGASGSGSWSQQTTTPYGILPTIGIGTVTTGDSASSVSVTTSGSAGSQLLNFSIPRGVGGPFTWRGNWSSATAYVANDTVFYPTTGNSYVAVQASTNQVPTNTTYWNTVAVAGAAGTNGTNGTNGTVSGNLSSGCFQIASVNMLCATGSNPALQGAPTAATASVNTNTTQLATTAFVLGQASSTTPSAPGSAAVGSSTLYARADHVHAKELPSPSTSGNVLTSNGSVWVSQAPSSGLFAKGTTNGSGTLNSAFNIASVTSSSSGLITWTFTTAAASSTSYVCTATANSSGAEVPAMLNSKSSTAVATYTTQASGAGVFAGVDILCFQ